MRIALVTLLNLISISAWAGTPQCGDAARQHADLLTSDQWRVVLGGDAGGDPVLEGAIAVETHKYKDDVPLSKTITLIEWSKARKLVLLGAVKQTTEGEHLRFVLVTISGQRYESLAPRAGDLDRLIHVVDPCGVYIRRVAL